MFTFIANYKFMKMYSKSEILIVPDKFKGSATAVQVADNLEVAIRKRFVHNDMLHIEKLPLADGGEGSFEVLQKILGAGSRFGAAPLTVKVKTFDPLRRPIESPILLFETEHGKAAFIEMAKCCGLVLLKKDEYNPEKTTTFGLGVMLKRAVEMGAGTIYLAIGGSATNDGGAGILEGYFGEETAKSEGLDSLKMFSLPEGMSFVVACDVNNPLLGPNGATMVYGRQKGADDEMLMRLEMRMEEYSQWASNRLRENGFEERAQKFASIEGGGAAGGVGAAMFGFFGAKLVSGWQFFGEMVSLEQKIAKADIVVTGEGRFDGQSLSGKLVGGVVSLCQKHKKRVAVVCGESLLDYKIWKKYKISNVFTLSTIEPIKERSIEDAAQLLQGEKAGRRLLEAGCDEAGRGCLAGPVFAAAVILPEGFYHPLLNDSKQLTPEQRETLRKVIESEALAWSVTAVDAAEIDRINILKASITGMQRALDKLTIVPELILVDGNKWSRYKNIPHYCIVGGDGKIASIAAASILAKTHRDEYMRIIAKEYPQYGWEKNMAYPTIEHRKAIEKFGTTKYHRLSYKLLPNDEGLFF